MFGLLRALVLCLVPAVVFAAGNSNDNGPENGGDVAVDCRDFVEGSEAGAVAVCGNLSIAKQKQICDADAVCAQYVTNVCGDVETVCKSDDTLFAIANAVASSKAACLQVNETVQATSVDCSQASLACGDQSTTNNQTCPSIDITVDEADVDCVKCVEKRTYFADGSIKSTRQRCYKCNVSGTLDID